MKIKISLILCGLGLSFSAHALTLNLNDISLLLPLPATESEDFLPQPGVVGGYGEILPWDIYQKLPSIRILQNKRHTYDHLRVVAVRLDPCFPTAAENPTCQAQVRLVWQPLEQQGKMGLTTADAAIHSFYNLSQAEFKALIDQLLNLKEFYQIPPNQLPLGVQPDFKRLGMQSAYVQSYLKSIFSYIGEERMSQITFMQLSGGSVIWVFGGFDIINGRMQMGDIPRISINRVQTFLNDVFEPTYFEGGFVPRPEGDQDRIDLLIVSSRQIHPEEQENEIRAAAIATARIENPLVHNPKTMDCVSCHLAQQARIYALRQFPWLALQPQLAKHEFKSRFNLTNTSTHPWHTQAIRGFGYFGIEPSISQRVINETAHTLDLMEHDR